MSEISWVTPITRLLLAVTKPVGHHHISSFMANFRLRYPLSIPDRAEPDANHLASEPAAAEAITLPLNRPQPPLPLSVTHLQHGVAEVERADEAVQLGHLFRVGAQQLVAVLGDDQQFPRQHRVEAAQAGGQHLVTGEQQG